MCDKCNSGYHIQCLGLAGIPAKDKWFYPNYKNDILCASGKSLMTKDRKKGTSRDWVEDLQLKVVARNVKLYQRIT